MGKKRARFTKRATNRKVATHGMSGRTAMMRLAERVTVLNQIVGSLIRVINRHGACIDQLVSVGAVDEQAALEVEQKQWEESTRRKADVGRKEQEQEQEQEQERTDDDGACSDTRRDNP